MTRLVWAYLHDDAFEPLRSTVVWVYFVSAVSCVFCVFRSVVSAEVLPGASFRCVRYDSLLKAFI